MCMYTYIMERVHFSKRSNCSRERERIYAHINGFELYYAFMRHHGQFVNKF